MAVTFEDVIASILLMRVDGQYHFEIVSDESGQVSNHRIRVLAFRLQNDAGIGPDYLLELNITLPLEECEQPDACIIVAPRICWGRKRWEVFRQFIIRLVNYQSAEEVDKEIQQSLALPLNRLHNSLNMYFPYLMDNKVVRQKVLGHLAPADVVRLDRVSVSLRNSLLSDTVDKGFWKPHYERLFGKATSEQPFTYRQEFFIKKKRQRQAATSLMSLRARQMPVISHCRHHLTGFGPCRPHPPGVGPFPPFLPQPTRPPYDDDPILPLPQLERPDFPPFLPQPTRPPYDDDPLPPLPQPERPDFPPFLPQPTRPPSDNPLEPQQPQPERPDDLHAPIRPSGPDLPPNWQFDGPGSSGGSGYF